jgi:DNA-binding transcriptional MerR regulator
MTEVVEQPGIETLSRGLSIGEVAARTGLSVHALRFYESSGILPDPVRRGPGGRRIYGEHDIEWLAVCIKLRASGMPLPAIREYTELVREGAGNEQERLAIMRRHRERVVAQIAELNECLNLISDKIEVYEGSLTRGEACLIREEAE